MEEKIIDLKNYDPYEKNCPKCGKIYIDESRARCEVCSTELRWMERTPVKRKCDNCGVVFIGLLEKFEEELYVCPQCEKGVLSPISIHNDVHNVVIDGSWNGVPIGKKIQEKNEQVKRKWAGMSHEQQSLKEKVGKMVNDRMGGKVM
jgi:hypothetical protein